MYPVKLADTGCLSASRCGMCPAELADTGCLSAVTERCSGCPVKLTDVGCWPALLESCVALSGEDTGCTFRLPGTIGCSILLADAIDWMAKPPETAGFLTVSAVPAETVSLDAAEDPIGSTVLSDGK